MTSDLPAPRGPATRALDLRLVLAYVGLTFGLAWAAWVPAAVLFRDGDRQGLPSITGGLVVLQTLGAVAPSVSAYLVLRASGHRDLLGWIGSRYRIWRQHAARHAVPRRSEHRAHDAVRGLPVARRDRVDLGGGCGRGAAIWPA